MSECKDCGTECLEVEEYCHRCGKIYCDDCLTDEWCKDCLYDDVEVIYE